MGFIGIGQPGEFREVTRSHVIAWRDDLASRAISSQTIRHRLVVVKGVRRPAVESYEGKTPALGDHQARQLLEDSRRLTGCRSRGKRDRAILAT